MFSINILMHLFFFNAKIGFHAFCASSVQFGMAY